MRAKIGICFLKIRLYFFGLNGSMKEYKPRNEWVRMKKKMLFCASTSSHIQNFHLPYIKAFHEQGYEVHVLGNKNVDIPFADKVFALNFEKSLLSFQNIKVFLKIKTLLRQECYQKISTNTALAAILVRAAVLFLKERPRVYHIAHGYLFNRNTGLKKWMYFLPEKMVAGITDELLVMNREDEKIAKAYHLYKGGLTYADGMGIPLGKYTPVTEEERATARRNYQIEEHTVVFTYAAELSNRKNHALLLRAFAKANLEHGLLLLAGDGSTKEECKALAKQLGTEDRVRFLGHVNDIPTLYAASDAVVSSSKIEGLPFNIMEAEGRGLPIIASDIKGHQELIRDGWNGRLIPLQEEQAFAKALQAFSNMPLQERKIWGHNSAEHFQNFTLDKVYPVIMKFYEEDALSCIDSKSN